MSAFVSRATVTAVGLTCKAVLNLGFCSLAVDGAHHLHNALHSPARNEGQGVITVANHISTLDDPLTWGVLPAHYYLSSSTTRWALGASDVIFTNPIFSTFFRLGQTLETFRGKGVHQPAVDTAIQKLNQGEWVHLYGEGKVNQPETYPKDASGAARLPRFKWGVGRILMETSIPPVIIPMWLTGFEKLMPEGRAFPYKYLPRYGAQLTVTFGSPIPSEEILRALGSFKAKALSPNTERPAAGWLEDKIAEEIHTPSIAREDLLRIRAEVTAVIQRRVEALGRAICGNSLTR